MRSLHEFLSSGIKKNTRRLAATYLVIIMSLTVVFSSVIYVISSSQFDRPLPSRVTQDWDYQYEYNVQDLFDQRADEARADLIASLVLLNMTVLVAGAFFSWFLARKTLEPIEAAMQAQSKFVSDASHELRTPLTALQVTNEVALRKKKLSIDDARELIEYNLAETIKLHNLSEALLGLAKQENENTASEEFDVSTMIDSAVESFKPLADDKSITIHKNAPAARITANKSALEHTLRILLDNAIKYSPENSSITILAKNEPSNMVISVRDEGPGIAAKHQTKIFDRFYRVDESRSSQNIEGSGLGLAIAKTIALRNGFGLSVQSAPGKGAEFSIRI